MTRGAASFKCSVGFQVRLSRVRRSCLSLRRDDDAVDIGVLVVATDSVHRGQFSCSGESFALFFMYF